MTVIQRVYLRAEKGTPVIHAWNVTAAAAAETATQDVLQVFVWFPDWDGLELNDRKRDAD